MLGGAREVLGSLLTLVYAVVTDCRPLICFCLAAMDVWSLRSFDANFRASLSRKISAPKSLVRPHTWERGEKGERSRERKGCDREGIKGRKRRKKKGEGE